MESRASRQDGGQSSAARPSARGGRATGAVSGAARHSPSVVDEPLRLAILDRELGLIVSLSKRIEKLGWQQRTLPVRVTMKTLLTLEADVLIVDLALLGEKRWRWLRSLCRQRPDLHVVVCTERSTVAERVTALRLGAADWLAKPCHPEELLARAAAVSAHARRFQRRVPELALLGDLRVDPQRFQAFAGTCSVGLTRTEYQLLELLARHAGETLARERIYEGVWGRAMARDDRSVDVIVYRLRRKLEAALPGWTYIHTQHRVGYRFQAERLARRTAPGAPASAPAHPPCVLLAA